MPINRESPEGPVRNRGAARSVATGVVLVLATVCVYLNSLTVPFFFDDGPAILRNESIRTLWPPWVALSPPANGSGVTARPLVNLSLAVNHAVGGLEVRGYHVMNLALHALAVLTLWGVARRTMGFAPVGRGHRTPPPSELRRDTVIPRCNNPELLAFGVALLWAVHPLLSESVVCVVQRNEIIGGLFYLLTLYGFIRAEEKPATGELNPERIRRSWQVISVLACLLGMASKEIVATAPLLVFLYDRTFVAGSFVAAWRERKGYYFALMATWLLLAWLMIGGTQRGGTVGFGLGVGAWEYLLTQCRALTTYLQLSVWPHPLIVDYGMEASRLGEVWWRGLVVLGLLGATVWALVRRPVWGFVGAWFFVILAPSSSVVPLTTQLIAEHRMYLPLIAVLVVGVAGLHRWAGRRAIVIVVLLAVVGGGQTIRRNREYQDEFVLWSDLIARQPDNARAHASLGYFYARREQWAEAAGAYAAAVRLRPDYADAHNDLAHVLARIGRAAEALEHHALAHRLKPEDPLLNFNYGTALAGAGRRIEAVERFEAALRVQPGLTDARNNLGLALGALGRRPEAMEQFREGLRRDPESVALRVNLANALFATGGLDEAAAEYARALELRPDFAAVRHSLAVTLERLGRVPEAIAQDEEALRLDPGLTAAREHLARLRGR